MAINERLIHTAAKAAAGGGTGNQEEGLILHLDANDVDSYDGDGSVWYDISEHDVTIPLSDNTDNLKIHYNPSDTDSYSGTGTTMSNLAESSLDANVFASRFDIDNGGFFDISTDSEATISVPTGHPLNGANFTLEFWFKSTEDWNNGGKGHYFIYEGGAAGWNFFYYEGYGWRLSAPVSTGYFGNGTVVTNKWHHVSLTYTGGTTKFYLDGELLKTHSATRSSSSLGAFDFGSTESAAYKPKCLVGAIRMYDIALTAPEIGQNYRHGRDYIYTGLAGTPFLHYDPADTNSYSGTGTTLTDLVGNNNADLLGGIESGWDEELGNSFPITGSGDGITTSNAVSINPATDGMTIEMWVKISTDSQNYLFSFDGTNTTYFGLSYRSNTDKITWFYRNSGGSTSAVNSDTIVLNEWTHIVATTDGSSAQFYTNGVLSEETSSSAYNYTYNEDLHFGNMYDLAQNSNSDIGQIRFYKGGLTADEVMQNFNFTKNDYPNGYNGTISGATWNSGGYFDFDGNDYVQTSFNQNLLTFSFSIWAKFDNVNTSVYPSTLISKNSYYAESITDFPFYVAQQESAIKIVGSRGNDYTADYILSSSSVSANTWYFITAVVDFGNTIKLYINGNEEDSVNYTVALSENNRSITLGRANLERSGGIGNSGLDGKISKFKMHDKALTQAEITALYNEGE